MATEAETLDPVSVTKVAGETLHGEMQKLEQLELLHETNKKYPNAIENIGSETVNTVIKGDVEISEGENFFDSPLEAKVAADEKSNHGNIINDKKVEEEIAKTKLETEGEESKEMKVVDENVAVIATDHVFTEEKISMNETSDLQTNEENPEMKLDKQVFDVTEVRSGQEKEALDRTMDTLVTEDKKDHNNNADTSFAPKSEETYMEKEGIFEGKSKEDIPINVDAVSENKVSDKNVSLTGSDNKDAQRIEEATENEGKISDEISNSETSRNSMERNEVLVVEQEKLFEDVFKACEKSDKGEITSETDPKPSESDTNNVQEEACGLESELVEHEDNKKVKTSEVEIFEENDDMKKKSESEDGLKLFSEKDECKKHEEVPQEEANKEQTKEDNKEVENKNIATEKLNENFTNVGKGEDTGQRNTAEVCIAENILPIRFSKVDIHSFKEDIKENDEDVKVTSGQEKEVVPESPKEVKEWTEMLKKAAAGGSIRTDKFNEQENAEQSMDASSASKRDDEGKNLIAIQDKVDDKETIEIIENKQSERSIHEERPDDLRQKEPEKDNIEGSLNMDAEVVSEAALTESAEVMTCVKEEMPIKSQEESFDASEKENPMDKNVPLIEFPSKNADDVHVVIPLAEEATENKVRILNVVPNELVRLMNNEANEVPTDEEKHVEESCKNANKGEVTAESIPKQESLSIEHSERDETETSAREISKNDTKAEASERTKTSENLKVEDTKKLADGSDNIPKEPSNGEDGLKLILEKEELGADLECPLPSMSVATDELSSHAVTIPSQTEENASKKLEGGPENEEDAEDNLETKDKKIATEKELETTADLIDARKNTESMGLDSNSVTEKTEVENETKKNKIAEVGVEVEKINKEVDVTSNEFEQINAIYVSKDLSEKETVDICQGNVNEAQNPGEENDGENIIKDSNVGGNEPECVKQAEETKVEGFIDEDFKIGENESMEQEKNKIIESYTGFDTSLKKIDNALVNANDNVENKLSESEDLKDMELSNPNTDKVENLGRKEIEDIDDTKDNQVVMSKNHKMVAESAKARSSAKNILEPKSETEQSVEKDGTEREEPEEVDESLSASMGKTEATVSKDGTIFDTVKDNADTLGVIKAPEEETPSKHMIDGLVEKSETITANVKTIGHTTDLAYVTVAIEEISFKNEEGITEFKGKETKSDDQSNILPSTTLQDAETSNTGMKMEKAEAEKPLDEVIKPVEICGVHTNSEKAILEEEINEDNLKEGAEVDQESSEQKQEAQNEILQDMDTKDNGILIEEGKLAEPDQKLESAVESDPQDQNNKLVPESDKSQIKDNTADNRDDEKEIKEKEKLKLEANKKEVENVDEGVQQQSNHGEQLKGAFIKEGSGCGETTNEAIKLDEPDEKLECATESVPQDQSNDILPESECNQIEEKWAYSQGNEKEIKEKEESKPDADTNKEIVTETTKDVFLIDKIKDSAPTEDCGDKTEISKTEVKEEQKEQDLSIEPPARESKQEIREDIDYLTTTMVTKETISEEGEAVQAISASNGQGIEETNVGNSLTEENLDRLTDNDNAENENGNKISMGGYDNTKGHDIEEAAESEIILTEKITQVTTIDCEPEENTSRVMENTIVDFDTVHDSKNDGTDESTSDSPVVDKQDRSPAAGCEPEEKDVAKAEESSTVATGAEPIKETETSVNQKPECPSESLPEDKDKEILPHSNRSQIEETSNDEKKPEEEKAMEEKNNVKLAIDGNEERYAKSSTGKAVKEEDDREIKEKEVQNLEADNSKEETVHETAKAAILTEKVPAGGEQLDHSEENKEPAIEGTTNEVMDSLPVSREYPEDADAIEKMTEFTEDLAPSAKESKIEIKEEIKGGSQSCYNKADDSSETTVTTETISKEAEAIKVTSQSNSKDQVPTEDFDHEGNENRIKVSSNEENARVVIGKANLDEGIDTKFNSDAIIESRDRGTEASSSESPVADEPELREKEINETGESSINETEESSFVVVNRDRSMETIVEEEITAIPEKSLITDTSCDKQNQEDEKETKDTEYSHSSTEKAIKLDEPDEKLECATESVPQDQSNDILPESDNNPIEEKWAYSQGDEKEIKEKEESKPDADTNKEIVNETTKDVILTDKLSLKQIKDSTPTGDCRDKTEISKTEVKEEQKEQDLSIEPPAQGSKQEIREDIDDLTTTMVTEETISEEGEAVQAISASNGQGIEETNVGNSLTEENLDRLTDNDNAENENGNKISTEGSDNTQGHDIEEAVEPEIILTEEKITQITTIDCEPEENTSRVMENTIADFDTVHDSKDDGTDESTSDTPVVDKQDSITAAGCEPEEKDAPKTEKSSTVATGAEPIAEIETSVNQKLECPSESLPEDKDKDILPHSNRSQIEETSNDEQKPEDEKAMEETNDVKSATDDNEERYAKSSTGKLQEEVEKSDDIEHFNELISNEEHGGNGFHAPSNIDDLTIEAPAGVEQLDNSEENKESTIGGTTNEIKDSVSVSSEFSEAADSIEKMKEIKKELAPSAEESKTEITEEIEEESQGCYNKADDRSETAVTSRTISKEDEATKVISQPNSQDQVPTNDCDYDENENQTKISFNEEEASMVIEKENLCEGIERKIDSDAIIETKDRGSEASASESTVADVPELREKGIDEPGESSTEEDNRGRSVEPIAEDEVIAIPEKSQITETGYGKQNQEDEKETEDTKYANSSTQKVQEEIEQSDDIERIKQLNVEEEHRVNGLDELQNANDITNEEKVSAPIWSAYTEAEEFKEKKETENSKTEEVVSDKCKHADEESTVVENPNGDDVIETKEVPAATSKPKVQGDEVSTRQRQPIATSSKVERKDMYESGENPIVQNKETSKEKKDQTLFETGKSLIKETSNTNENEDDDKQEKERTPEENKDEGELVEMKLISVTVNESNGQTAGETGAGHCPVVENPKNYEVEETQISSNRVHEIKDQPTEETVETEENAEKKGLLGVNANANEVNESKVVCDPMYESKDKGIEETAEKSRTSEIAEKERIALENPDFEKAEKTEIAPGFAKELIDEVAEDIHETRENRRVEKPDAEKKDFVHIRENEVNSDQAPERQGNEILHESENCHSEITGKEKENEEEKKMNEKKPRGEDGEAEYSNEKIKAVIVTEKIHERVDSKDIKKPIAEAEHCLDKVEAISTKWEIVNKEKDSAVESGEPTKTTDSIEKKETENHEIGEYSSRERDAPFDKKSEDLPKEEQMEETQDLYKKVSDATETEDSQKGKEIEGVKFDNMSSELGSELRNGYVESGKEGETEEIKSDEVDANETVSEGTAETGQNLTVGETNTVTTMNNENAEKEIQLMGNQNVNGVNEHEVAPVAKYESESRGVEEAAGISIIAGTGKSLIVEKMDEDPTNNLDQIGAKIAVVEELKPESDLFHKAKNQTTKESAGICLTAETTDKVAGIDLEQTEKGSFIVKNGDADEETKVTFDIVQKSQHRVAVEIDEIMKSKLEEKDNGEESKEDFNEMSDSQPLGIETKDGEIRGDNSSLAEKLEEQFTNCTEFSPESEKIGDKKETNLDFVTSKKALVSESEVVCSNEAFNDSNDTETKEKPRAAETADERLEENPYGDKMEASQLPQIISSKQIAEEAEVAKTSQPISQGLQEDEKKPEKCMVDKSNGKFEATLSEIQKKELMVETESYKINQGDKANSEGGKKEIKTLNVKGQGSTKGLVEDNELIQDIQKTENVISLTNKKQILTEAGLSENAKAEISAGNAEENCSEAGEIKKGEKTIDDSSDASLLDLLKKSRKETQQVAKNVTAEREKTANAKEGHAKEETIQHKEAHKNEVEGEEGHKTAESSPDAPVMVETSRDIDAEAAHKKSHNILSGVGSKFKRSISMVKKAMVCHHPEPMSPR